MFDEVALTTYRTAEAALKSFKTYCWFFSFSPCYWHLSRVHPSTTQVSLSSSLSPPPPTSHPTVFMVIHVYLKMYCMHEKREIRKNVKLFLRFLCFVLFLPPSFNDANLLFLYNCVFLFSPCVVPHLSTLSLGTLTPPKHRPSPLIPKSLTAKTKKELCEIGAPSNMEKKKKIGQTLDFTKEEDRNRLLNEWKRLQWYMKCAVAWRVLSGLSAEQHQREEMEVEKCEEDRKGVVVRRRRKKERSVSM